MPTSLSLVLIEDNRLLREGIAALIRQRLDLPVLAASADVDEARQKVREVRPDIVLLAGSENDNSLCLAATIHQENPETKIVVMGLSPPRVDIIGFVRAGASGFLMKDAVLDEFVTTIHAVAAGASVLPPPLTASLFAQIVRQPVLPVPTDRSPVTGTVRLTQRERQVIHLIGEGLSNKEIAARLRVAVHTVKSHVHNVLEKLDLHSRLEIVTFTHMIDEAQPPRRSRVAVRAED